MTGGIVRISRVDSMRKLSFGRDLDRLTGVHARSKNVVRPQAPAELHLRLGSAAQSRSTHPAELVQPHLREPVLGNGGRSCLLIDAARIQSY